MANITKYVKMLMRKGLKSNLDTLDEAEIGLATDTKEVFVGSDTGNIQLAKQSDVKDNQDKVGILQEFSGVSVESFKRLTGESDDSGRTQRAADSLPSGGTLIFPYGKTYRLNNVSVVGKSLKIIGFGATLIQNANKPILDLRGGWDFVVGVASITNTTYDYSQGNNAITQVTKITLQSTQNLKAGDVVKVVSDDELTGTLQKTTGTQRKRTGEFATVGYVSGNDVYLTDRLRENYTNNIRLAKLSDVTFKIDLTFDTDEIGDSQSWNSKLLKIAVCRDVELNVKCLKGYDTFVLLLGVFGYTAKVSVQNLRNETAKGRYGYGINDSSCENGYVYASHFVNCRHGFTTTTGYIDPNANEIESYGRSANTTIEGSFGVGCSNAPFDVHEDAYNISFINCHATHNYAGDTASGYGFQARARKIRFIGCTVNGGRGGFNVFEQYAGTTDDVEIIDCKTMNVETSLLVTGRLEVGVRSRNVRVNGGVFESYGSIGNQYVNCDVTFDNSVIRTNGYQSNYIGKDASVTYNSGTKFYLSGSSDSTRVFDLVDDGATLTLNDIRLDTTKFTGNNAKLIRISQKADLNLFNGSVYGDKWNVVTGNSSVLRVIDCDPANTNTVVKVTNISVDKDMTVLADSDFDTLAYSFKTPTKSSAAIYQDMSADGAANTKGIANNSFFLRIKPLNADRTITSIPAGYLEGQILVIRNSSQSGTSYNVIVPNGGIVAVGTNRTIVLNGALTLMWTGTQWVNTVA